MFTVEGTMYLLISLLVTVVASNIEVKHGFTRFIQSPLLGYIGVSNNSTTFQSLPNFTSPSYFGYSLNTQNMKFWIGAPKAIGNHSLDDSNSSASNIKNAGAIFQCDGGDFFTDEGIYFTNYSRISPNSFVAGDHFGLNIQSPYEETLQTCTPTRSLECAGGLHQQPGYCFRSNNTGKTWGEPINVSGDECRSTTTTLDVMFVLDGSTSVGEDNFETVKSWTSTVARQLYEFDNDTQIGVIQYSHWDENKNLENQPFIKTEIELQNQSPSSFMAAMEGISLFTHTTYTAHALEKTILDLQGSHRYNKRTNNKVIILLTDGKSSDRAHLYTTAERLKSLGIITFAVGVARFDEEELQIITHNNSERYFTLADFTDLSSIVNELQTQLISVTLEGDAGSVSVTLHHEFGEIGFSSSRRVCIF